MADLVRLADVEHLVTRYLATELGGVAHVGLIAPVGRDIVGHLPFVRVARRGGLADHLTRFDRPVLDIDIWHTTNQAVNSLGSLVRALMAAARGLTDLDLGCSITSTTEVTGPQRLPEEDPSLVRLGFAVGLTVRSLV